MDNYIFGDNLRTLRENKGYSQQYVASLVGCGRSAIAQYELSAKVPTMFVALKLAKLYGTTVENIAFGKVKRKAVKRIDESCTESQSSP